jgi:NitT/TauT family transport system ATP-binding protein
MPLLPTSTDESTEAIPKIDVRGLSKSYGQGGTGVLALDRVDLRVRDGEFVSIVGPSGCGKSTLLYMLGGFIRGDGSLAVDGRAISGPGLDRGIVFQEYALFPWLNVHDNIAFGLEMRKLERAERIRLIEQYIALIGLQGFERRFPRELSGGMKQRVALARTLVYEPDILLLDEPFGALDAQTREIMQDELLRVWRETRKTVLMVTHDVNEAVYLSDRVCVMSQRPGTIVEEFVIDLDKRGTREEIVLSDAFEQQRNRVWISVRAQATRAIS